MSATAAPYGFVPVKHPSGQNRAESYPIASAYGTSIFKGDVVKLDTTNGIILGTVGAAILGIFVGCEYIDATGKPVVSPYWPASTATFGSVAATAWIITDPATVFSVQANGAVPIAAIGDQADFVAGTGSTISGASAEALNSTLGGAGVQKQFRIIGLDGDVSNAWNDTYTKVLVQIAQSQYVAPATAI
jgi:hypothetical protein